MKTSMIIIDTVNFLLCHCPKPKPKIFLFFNYQDVQTEVKPIPIDESMYQSAITGEETLTEAVERARIEVETKFNSIEIVKIQN